MTNLPSSLILAGLKAILTQITPPVRKFLNDFITNLEDMAKDTASPWDNILVQILKDIFDME